MAVKRYNATLRNLEYRLRAFKDDLPNVLEDAIYACEDSIVSAIANDQLYRRGVDGDDVKIASYAPYAPRTIARKLKKGQPIKRVTLRDTKEFHDSMFVVVDSEGFYVTATSYKTPFLEKKYGPKIFRLTNKNLTRIINSHIRKEITKKLKQAIKP